MLQKTSKEFKSVFLLLFTEELIKHSVSEDFFERKELSDEIYPLTPTEKTKQEIKEIIKEREKKITPAEKRTQEIKKIIKEKEKKTVPLSKNQIIPLRKISPLIRRPLLRRPFSQRAMTPTPRKILRAPTPKIPKHLQYLKPVPNKDTVDLSKLNDLIKDPLVRVIRCNGENQNLVVIGTMGTKKTNILLSKEDIEEVIQKFSQASKIPVSLGIFRVAVGNLIFSAVVSDVVSSKFIIEKMIRQNIIPQREI